MSLRTAQDKVRTRDGHYCVRCGSSVLDTPSSIHHRKPRGMGGTNNPLSYDLRNLVRLCGTGTTGCHGEIEANRAQALEDGWLIQSFAELGKPMVRTDGMWLVLDGEDATIHYTDPSPRPTCANAPQRNFWNIRCSDDKLWLVPNECPHSNENACATCDVDRYYAAKHAGHCPWENQ